MKQRKKGDNVRTCRLGISERYCLALNSAERLCLFLRERFLSLRFLDDTDATIGTMLHRLEIAFRRAGTAPIPLD